MRPPMPQAIRIQQSGGPEVMSLGSAPDAAPGPGEALVRVEAAGVNFIDTYHRTGSTRSRSRSLRAWRARASWRRWAPAFRTWRPATGSAG